MIRHPLPWYRKGQLFLVHRLSSPVQRFFTRFPQWEYGLSRPEISQIECPHGPLVGKRAVHLSDLHLDRYQPRHDVALTCIAAMRPDWIFVTGDLLNVPDGLPHVFRFLSALRELAPVYLTLGNHDHFSGVPVHLFSEMADRHKIHLLMNQAVFVPAGSGELAIVGVDDPCLHRADLRCIPSKPDGRFTILLAHAPNVIDYLGEAHAVDLVLCGHSHGGQWRIPYIRPFWLPYGCHGRVSGLSHHKGFRLYVNRGLGWSILPIRWRCAPEIVIIDWIADRPRDNPHPA